jgi:hypothetical protein
MGILDVATCYSYLCISLPLSASLMSKWYDTMRGECCTRTLASICKYNIDHIYEKGCSIQRMQHSEKVLIYNIRIELLQHHYIFDAEVVWGWSYLCRKRAIEWLIFRGSQVMGVMTKTSYCKVRWRKEVS